MHHYVNNWSVTQVILSLSFLNTLIKAYRPVIILSMEILTANSVKIFLVCLLSLCGFKSAAFKFASLSILKPLMLNTPVPENRRLQKRSPT